jgi:hypothetical protein
MKDTIANKVTSFSATLGVADKPEHQVIWQNQPPQAFTDGLALARASTAALIKTGAQQSAPITGVGAAFKALRKDFEAGLYRMARATFQCLTKLGNTVDAAKVDLSPTDLHDARGVALAGLGETVLDLAEPLTQPPAPGTAFGITTASVAVVNDLWSRYSTAVGAPVSARSKRKAQTTDLSAQCAATEAQYAVLDDLVVQFDGTPAGKQFVETWFAARNVVELGTHHAQPPAPPTLKPAQ